MSDAADDFLDWKPKLFSTADRLTVASEVLARLQARYEDRLAAVALEGSTAKGMDRPESDLELRAIFHGDVPHRWYAFFHHGLFVGISYTSVAAEEAKAREVTYTWPVTGDAVWTARVLYDPADVYGLLRALAAEAEARADFTELAREALTDMYEHVYKVFAAHPDDMMTVAAEARGIAYWAAMAVGLVNRHRYLSSRALYAESMTLPSRPAHYADALPELLSLATTADRVRHHVSLLWQSTRAWARELGIRLDDDDLAGV
ncbi:kanamycin nucleotidyltransferase C-terminal domain-containing protein [Alicyclobacillus macrosporangiidus]|uniref:kanamycin nucleotidyltransferase C-terminal domain-containing protein n=1 Tax=Alicyclobacillus macrosporangiidus TaxID=392015 RepID=UPI0004966A24|nr:kanamycin nucleotidyltransferase C-terminal domain-containing protein [Alicyclobacillus macrosporangiidus]